MKEDFESNADDDVEWKKDEKKNENERIDKRRRNSVRLFFRSFVFFSHSIPVFIFHVGVCFVIVFYYPMLAPSAIEANAWTRWRTTFDFVRLNGSICSSWSNFFRVKRFEWLWKDRIIDFCSLLSLNQKKSKTKRTTNISKINISNLSLEQFDNYLFEHIDEQLSRYVCW